MPLYGSPIRHTPPDRKSFMTAVLLSLATFASTFCGGLFALKNNDRLHYILSFTRGRLLGVVSFDLLPEIYKMAATSGTDRTGAMIALVGDSFSSTRSKNSSCCTNVHEALTRAPPPEGRRFLGPCACRPQLHGRHRHRPRVQVSKHMGLVVGAAVNRARFLRRPQHRQPDAGEQEHEKHSFVMLLLDAAAPVLGALSTLAFTRRVGIDVLLGFFAGFCSTSARRTFYPKPTRRPRRAGFKPRQPDGDGGGVYFCGGAGGG